MDIEELRTLKTENFNPNSNDLDLKSTEDLIKIINQEDKKVADAIEHLLPKLTIAVDSIVHSFKNKGKLFFIGAGTSGRLGVLQQAECPPTFSSDPEMVQAIIAGGKKSILEAQEGFEDKEQLGAKQIKRKLNQNDVLVCLTASGRAPFVFGAMKAAKKLGCKTISVTCNPQSQISELADIPLDLNLDPPLISGSTRWQPATAQKMILDMLTSASFIKLGYTYDNYMISLQAKANKKLEARAERIVSEILQIEPKQAKELLEDANYNVKTAIAMRSLNLSKEIAEKELKTKSLREILKK